VVARFDGGTISSDAGGLLLRETDRRIRLLKRLRDCFRDGDVESEVTAKDTECRVQCLGRDQVSDREKLSLRFLLG
jgi:hypothetical protein